MITVLADSSYSISYTTGSGIKGAILSACKVLPGNKFEPMPGDGVEFESQELAQAFCLEKGYVIPYVRKAS
jgi:hypothetical protein